MISKTEAYEKAKAMLDQHITSQLAQLSETLRDEGAPEHAHASVMEQQRQSLRAQCDALLIRIKRYIEHGDDVIQ